MQLRKLATVVLSVTLLACGRDSTPTGPTSVLGLTPGTYALTVTMSTFGEPICTNGVCIAGGACAGQADQPAVRALTTVIRLDRSGDALTVRPEDSSASFRMNLQIAANALTGTAAGQFRDPTLQLSLAIAAGHPGQSAAVATGNVMTTSVAGKIDGQISVGAYSCSNNGHTWTLVPR